MARAALKTGGLGFPLQSFNYTHMIKNNIIKTLAACALAVGLSGSAFGLTFTAASATAASGDSNDPANAADVKAALGLSYNLTELYWASQGGDGGTFDSGYSTNFTASNTDVTVSDTGSPNISGYGALFLLALGDDDASPDWKIFNITGWNGTEQIFLDRVFPKAGDSNKYDVEKVIIFGGNPPQQPNNGVPDGGSTALLLGSALVALGFAARRKRA